MRKEIFKKRTEISLLLFFLLLSMQTALHAEAQEKLPDNCYANDGFVDLQTCDLYSWEIPLENLEQGYYGALGSFVPGLAPEDLHTFNPGNLLEGSATYTRRGFLQGVLTEKAERWNLNPEDFIGAIATDSCGYIGMVAWIRKGDNDTWRGPFLVGDCAAAIHQYERACYMGTIIELDYEDFSEYQSRGRLDGMQVFFRPNTDLSSPSDQTDSEPVSYSQQWIDASGLICSNE